MADSVNSTVVSGVGSATSAGAKRLEIEGLRTVAALLVAAYHIWFNRVSGGVDVFFVITGYLITRTLVGHVRREGRVRPLAYLGRLARRVWPMAATVLLCVLVLTWVLAPAALRARNFSEVLASALYGENWFLALNAVDYLNAEDPHTPVQHFWAMSVQGQFYLVWLALAVLATVAARQLAARSSSGDTAASGLTLPQFSRAFAILIATVGVASFAWSVWQTSVAQPFAYFSTLTRLWEFSVGGLLALAGSRIRLRGVAAGVASWVSVLGLVALGLVLPVANVFPGWLAAWPVTCAALLLASTREDERSWAATRLLAWRPVSWLGGVAFGIYLWHFPLLIGYRYLRGEQAVPGRLTGLALIGAAVVLAVVGHYLVERPIQQGWTAGRGRRPITVVLVTALVAVVAGALLGQAQVAKATAGVSEQIAQARQQLGDCYGFGALGDPDGCAPALDGAPLLPDREALLNDTGKAYSCYAQADDADITTCTFGSGPLRVALVGNSHAAMFIPTLRRHADELEWNVTTITGNGCLWSEKRPSDSPSEPCFTRLSQAEELLLGDDPFDAVLFSGGRRMSTDAPELVQRRFDQLQRNWQELAAHGSKVIVIEDNPRIGLDGTACVVESADDQLRAGDCDQPRDRATADDDLFEEVAETLGYPVVPTTDLYCTDTACPVVIGSVIVYRDEHHLTATYLESAEDRLLERIAPLVR